ncbi:MAG TPA: hypothetical protein VFC75_00765 [Erysipelothrix sp.]|nr:hypothetical protein [Erysipelothrix sp.]
MKNVYILLTDTGSVLTTMIKHVTTNPYNHVSISFDEDLETLYSFGRKHPNNPFLGGFVKESIYSGTFKKFKNTTCMVLKFEVSDNEYNLLNEQIDFFVANMDKYHYNLIGLIGAYFNRRVPRKNAYFCSEFVADVLYKSDLNIWDIPPHMVRPYDFGIDDRFEVIYEGLLRDYATLRRNVEII